MKLASILAGGEAVYGRVNGDAIEVPADEFRARFPDLKSVLVGDALAELAQTDAAQRVSINDAEFLPLIPNSGRILCVGINFRAHMKEMGHEPSDTPVLFVRFNDSNVGHGQPLLHPGVSEQYDYEGEFACVIGRTAYRVKAADAYDYVAGYTCFMDGSVRDWQRHASQFTPGKNFYRSGSFGPWLVTADEIPDPKQLKLETRLNGKVMQRGEISDLKFGIPELIEYCSTFCKLQPGDVISTGTPSGVGFGRTPPVWLKPGDALEVEIDQIGVLKNSIVAAD
jgi:2-keto-4-pentenoate hydratase/2-oxohepta-3-ene-1,7-dioic acid hydratase in catechol pathway